MTDYSSRSGKTVASNNVKPIRQLLNQAPLGIENLRPRVQGSNIKTLPPRFANPDFSSMNNNLSYPPPNNRQNGFNCFPPAQGCCMPRQMCPPCPPPMCYPPQCPPMFCCPQPQPYYCPYPCMPPPNCCPPPPCPPPPCCTPDPCNPCGKKASPCCGAGATLVCVPKGCKLNQNQGKAMNSGTAQNCNGMKSMTEQPASYNNCNFYVTELPKGFDPKLLRGKNGSPKNEEECEGDEEEVCPETIIENYPGGDGKVVPPPLGYPGSQRVPWPWGSENKKKINSQQTRKKSWGNDDVPVKGGNQTNIYIHENHDNHENVDVNSNQYPSVKNSKGGRDGSFDRNNMKANLIQYTPSDTLLKNKIQGQGGRVPSYLGEASYYGNYDPTTTTTPASTERYFTGSTHNDHTHGHPIGTTTTASTERHFTGSPHNDHTHGHPIGTTTTASTERHFTGSPHNDHTHGHPIGTITTGRNFNGSLGHTTPSRTITTTSTERHFTGSPHNDHTHGHPIGTITTGRNFNGSLGHTTPSRTTTTASTERNFTGSLPNDHTLGRHPTHSTNDHTLGCHPTHSTNNHTLGLHPTHSTNNHTLGLHPTHSTNDHTLGRHPTNDHTLGRHPTHSTNDHTLGRHPTEIKTFKERNLTGSQLEHSTPSKTIFTTASTGINFEPLPNDQTLVRHLTYPTESTTSLADSTSKTIFTTASTLRNFTASLNGHSLEHGHPTHPTESKTSIRNFTGPLKNDHRLENGHPTHPTESTTSIMGKNFTGSMPNNKKLGHPTANTNLMTTPRARNFEGQTFDQTVLKERLESKNDFTGLGLNAYASGNGNIPNIIRSEISLDSIIRSNRAINEEMYNTPDYDGGFGRNLDSHYVPSDNNLTHNHDPSQNLGLLPAQSGHILQIVRSHKPMEEDTNASRESSYDSDVDENDFLNYPNGKGSQGSSDPTNDGQHYRKKNPSPQGAQMIGMCRPRKLKRPKFTPICKQCFQRYNAKHGLNFDDCGLPAPQPKTRGGGFFHGRTPTRSRGRSKGIKSHFN